MKRKQSDSRTQRKPLRLWPGIVLAVLIVLFKFIIPLFIPDALALTMFGGFFSGLLVIIWWAFFSRARLPERLIAVFLIIAALVSIRPLLHLSIAQAGMGMLFFILAIPYTALAFALWAIMTKHLQNRMRLVTMALAILLAVGAWTLLRTGGITNEGQSDFSWRWSQSTEEQLLETQELPANSQVVIDSIFTKPEWPGFRGTNRDGIVYGSNIDPDWTTHPPQQLWKQLVGPGWSSFSVQGDLFYTQEQRGEYEAVSCYNIHTGKLVWQHTDKTRFWESNGGAGPRATPTLHNGRVYSLGATGIVNVLNAGNGEVIWSRNAAKKTKTETPIWGFSGSPLVVNNTVIVALAGSLIAYDIHSGEQLWSTTGEIECYSSAHLATLDSVQQIIFQNKAGAAAYDPASGKVLWDYAWPGNPIVQPTILTDHDILVSVDDRNGVRRLSLHQNPSGWQVDSLWCSDDVKPYFNDSVFHKGYLYGFDGRSLASINIENGERQWKGGRYGRGQFILLADQDLILVISEKGDLALVNAVPDAFTERVRVPAIKGKTWNHPVLVDDILLVRNAEEMAAFELTSL